MSDPENAPRAARADLSDVLAGLSTEAVNPQLSDLDTRSTADLVEIMVDQDRLIPEAVAKAAPAIATAVDGISDRLRRGGRLIYLGAGTAGRLGILDASECPPTFGTDPALVVGIIAGGLRAVRAAVEGAEDDPNAGEADLRGVELNPDDSVVGISASGRTPYVVGGLTYAARVGALTVSLSGNSGSEIGRVADVAIDVVVGPEVVAGSTRLRAGTAQKMVLNMISTIAMVRLGKTYGNLMVDLSATNEKLRARAERTVTEAAGVTPATAAAALSQAEGSVKLAILMLETGLAADGARRLLERHHGYLRAAVGDCRDP